MGFLILGVPLEGMRNMTSNGSATRTRDLWDLYTEARDPGVRDRLVMEHLPMVRRLCRRFYRTGEPLDDLMQWVPSDCSKP